MTQRYLTFLPLITMSALAEPLFAVANTFGLSFFGFLISLFPRFFSLDMVASFAKTTVRRMPVGSLLRRRSGRVFVRTMIPGWAEQVRVDAPHTVPARATLCPWGTGGKGGLGKLWWCRCGAGCPHVDREGKCDISMG